MQLLERTGSAAAIRFAGQYFRRAAQLRIRQATVRASLSRWLFVGAALLGTEHAAAGSTSAAPPLECVDGTGRIQVPAKEIAHLETGDVAPRLVKSVSPPRADPSCEAPRIHQLVVEGVIDTSGKVCAVRLIKPEGSCRTEPYLAALRQSIYTPAMRKGKTVAVYFSWSVSIHLQ